MRSQEDLEQDELELGRLFDATATSPTSTQRNRMMARAASIPKQGGRIARRWRWWILSAGPVALAILLLGLWLRIPGGTGPTDQDLLDPASGLTMEEALDLGASAGDPYANLDLLPDTDDDLQPALEPFHSTYGGEDERAWIQVYDALLSL